MKQSVFMQYICIAVLLLCANLVQAQNTISGKVIDKQTKEPIFGATIAQLNTSKSVKTNSLGQFSLELANSTDSIAVIAYGFKVFKSSTSDIPTTIGLEDLSQHTLETFVVSASREQEKRTESPVALSVISPKTIAENNPVLVSEVLNQTPGVYMVDLGNEQHSMSIRQPLSYKGVYLYLEDGIPIRTSGVFNHNALLEMNMANVSRLEIIRGPSSSLYGSEAIGGAINFITKKPSAIPTAGISLQGNNLGYKRTDFNASGTFKKLGLRLSGYYANRRNGYRKHSDLDKLALTIGANYSFSENTFLDFSTTAIDYTSDMTGSLDSISYYNKNYESAHTFTNRKVRALRSKISVKHYWNAYAQTSLTAVYRNNSIEQNPSYRVKDDFKPWKGTGDKNKAHGEVNNNSFSSYAAILQHKHELSKNKSSIIAGASVDYSPNTYKANYISIYKSPSNIYESFVKSDSLLANYKVNLLNTAAYLQGDYSPFKSLKIIGAIRYDHFHYDFQNSLDSNAFSGVPSSKSSYSQITPKLGVTLDLKKSRGLYINYSLGFTPPQVSELYRGVKVPELKPATYSNYELGGWFGFNNEKGKFELAFYQMDGTNEIISVVDSDGKRENKNAGKTQHLGVEYAVNYAFNKSLHVRLSGTNAKHKFIDFVESGNDFSSKEMDRAPKWIANAAVSYAPKWVPNFKISGEWQHMDPYYMDAANQMKYNGFDVFNVRVNYQWKALKVWCNVMNIGDELYATNASKSRWGQRYSPGNPRTYNVGIAYQFSKSN